MKLVLGLIVVLGCVLGGFVLHHGNLALLIIPTEYLIICGMALGGLIVSSPPRVIKSILSEVMAQLTGRGTPKASHYVDMLRMIYELMQLARKEGVLALEGHVNNPADSSIIGKYSTFMRDPHAVDFMCDTLKLFVAGVLDPHDLDELMEGDLEVMHDESLQASRALQNVADSLPAIGIVAAVLGIILTMQAIDQGAAAVGIRVAGALVGTFLGVFLAYGFVGPVANALAASAQARGRYHACIRNVLRASINGVNPPMAVEIGRRNIYMSERPSFEDLEDALRDTRGS